MSSAAEIQPDGHHQDRQAHLRNLAARYVLLVDRHTATVGGTRITLNPQTGYLSCSVCPPQRRPDPGECWHIRRLLEVAYVRRRQ